MSSQIDKSTERWKHGADAERIQAELKKGKRQMIYVSIVAAIAIVLLLVTLLGDKGKNETGFHGGAGTVPEKVEEINTAETETTPAVPDEALPTDIAEIEKLLSNSENPVVRVTTTKGNMLFELYEDKVPNTVANMIELAENGFYKGMSFHRIINDFMAQGGCPFSKRGATGQPGTGDPGYRFADEFNNSLKHTDRGILSMANSGPNTNGSQFFICFRATPHLDGKHSVFGKIIAGEKVLDRLEKIGTPSGSPKQNVRFNIEVVKKSDTHEYHVKKL